MLVTTSSSAENKSAFIMQKTFYW